jgi:hypothetical protein
MACSALSPVSSSSSRFRSPGQDRGGGREAPGGLRGEAEVADAAIRGVGLAGDQAHPLGPRDQLGDRALRQLEPLGEVGHGGALAAVGGALDHQQQCVALGGEAVPARDVLGPALEQPDGGA